MLSKFAQSGIYGAMALAGKFICSITGIDCMGGFHPSLDAILEGLGYAAPPIMALLFILDVSWPIILSNCSLYFYFYFFSFHSWPESKVISNVSSG